MKPVGGISQSILDSADGLVVFVVKVLQDDEIADFPDNPGEHSSVSFVSLRMSMNGAPSWENSILFFALAKGRFAALLVSSIRYFQSDLG